jgi:hypothetical protein
MCWGPSICVHFDAKPSRALGSMLFDKSLFFESLAEVTTIQEILIVCFSPIAVLLVQRFASCSHIALKRAARFQEMGDRILSLPIFFSSRKHLIGIF